MRFLLTLFLGVFLLASCGDSNNSPAVEQPVNAADLYLTRCAGCHGTDGNLQLSGAKALSASTLKKEEVVSQIKMGKGNMPPFDGRLTEKEFDALADYVLTFRAK